MKIGVLALQGAFIEHIKIMESLGAECVGLRQRSDIKGIDALILPGGESTVQNKLLRELDMYHILRNEILSGLPVLATCAGLILLSEKIENDSFTGLSTLPVTVLRNAYGRQLASFNAVSEFKGIGDIEMVFIRAPYVSEINNSEVEVLSTVDNKITAVKYQNQLGLSFHPELSDDVRVHQYFLEMI